MSIFFQTGGMLTTLQDLGRLKYRRFGINPNGTMDKTATRLLNILLGNRETEAVLEMHFPAPILQFESDAVIAIGGADFSPVLNDQSIENWRPIAVKKADVLTFPSRKFGARAYLVADGGFAAEEWLGSACTNLRAKIGGFQGRALRKNDQLFFKKSATEDGQRTNIKISPSLFPFYSRFPTVRVVAGAEWENLTEESRRDFSSGQFAIGSESDRMGFRLRGESLQMRENIELVSSAVNFGTIQHLPDGQLIILMADHQTTGGYGRIANVAAVDLPLLAQLNPNDAVNFHLITQSAAEDLLWKQEIELNYLRTAIRFL